ncbi:unnamed protein product [Ascophyllum nodosum]
MPDAPDTSECSFSSLSDATQEQLAIYAKDIYIEPDCLGGATPLLLCNYLGLGQECRGCFTTCDGAQDFVSDNPGEIAEVGVSNLLVFCPGAEVDDFSDC